MKDPRRSRLVAWAVPASLVLHGAILALLVFGLPSLMPTPEPEQTIPVTLVPPPAPEQPKAEPPKADAEKAPEPPPPAPPPPPPPPPPAKQDEAKTPQAPPMAALDPVFKFGPTDAGPRQALDGSSAKDAEADLSPNEPREPAEPTESPSPEAAPPQPEPAEHAPATAERTKDDAVGPQAMPELEAPDGAAPAQVVEAAKAPEPQPEPAPETQPDAAPAKAPEPEKPKPSEPKPSKPAKLHAARQLYSRAQTQAEMATTAMGSLPRDVRAGRICVTELRQQLLHASPRYFAEILPSYRLAQGNVLAVPNAAFRMGGQWFDLNFRCSVDADATEVTGFAFKVGAALPPSEWKRRGLPAQ